MNTKTMCKTLEFRRNGAVVYFQPHMTLAQKKDRLAVWLFLNGRCAFHCGRRATQWHHTTYQHESFPHTFEWMPCCRQCHERQHGYIQPANDNQIEMDFGTMRQAVDGRRGIPRPLPGDEVAATRQYGATVRRHNPSTGIGDGRSGNPPAASCGGSDIEADGSASYHLHTSELVRVPIKRR